MNDSKSKLPDLKEISSMAGKLFRDVKTSITEILVEYKKKREEDAAATAKQEAKANKKENVSDDTKSSKNTKKKNQSE